MKLLALDTSTERLALAVDNGGDAETLDADGGAAASARVIADALTLLAHRGLALRDLDAIAYACGPGAFTGLRTACAVAQGLAYGAGKPVLAIDSLLIVAEDARLQWQAAQGGAYGSTFDCAVAMDARMQQVYAAAYRYDGNTWHTVAVPALLDLPALRALWHDTPPPVIAGSALAAYAAELQCPAGAQPVTQTASRARALLQLARGAWQQGLLQKPADALPLYLRDRVALTTAERAAAAQGGVPRDEAVQ